VNERLDPKLEFAEAYRSLQTARNCLEHRQGIVTKIEAHSGDSFVLSIPRLKVFYMRGTDEVEIQPCHVVDSGDNRSDVALMMKLDVRHRSVPLGTPLTFTLAEFNEIAFACHFLGEQLSSRLPKLAAGASNTPVLAQPG